MKKHLLILAGLTLVFGAQARDPGQQQPSNQTRNGVLAACQKEVAEKGVPVEARKEAIAACVKAAQANAAK